MKHYLINIQHLTDGTTAKVIYSYDSRTEVYNAYHSTLLYNYSADDVKGFMVMITDDNCPITWERFDKSENEGGE